MGRRGAKSVACGERRAGAQGSFEEQLTQTAAILERELAQKPNELRVLWSARFYAQLMAKPSPGLRQASAHFDALRADLAEVTFRERMEEAGAVAHLVSLWNGLHGSGLGERAGPFIAAWLVDLSRDEELLEDLGDSAASYGEAALAERFHAAARSLARPPSAKESAVPAKRRPRVDGHILERLNRKHRDSIRFSLADRAVARGRRELGRDPGVVYHGKRGEWGTWAECFSAPPGLKPGELDTGQEIHLGQVERLLRGELRCYRAGDPGADAAEARIGFFREGKLASVELRFKLPAGRQSDTAFDVGSFTLVGPSVYVGTPFSDNDPDQCEIVTVDQLRDLGE